MNTQEELLTKILYEIGKLNITINYIRDLVKPNPIITWDEDYRPKKLI